ncbi:MAG: DUF481 domain-containing protein [Candidatus Marinimicrobia bacterium]|nr:DUF481 domain-containing protein [Candidatus Neomarinimicrobiota bacterium]
MLGQTLLAQVNTEQLRQAVLTPGLHSSLDADFGLVSGNSKLMQATGSLRFDYLRGNGHSFVVINRQLGQADSLLINKGFVHGRFTRAFSDKLSLETFAQNEFNDFIRLKSRNLAGGGFRVRWREAGPGDKKPTGIRLHTGIGLMWEQERILGAVDQADVKKNLLRSTNYLVFRWLPDERILMQATSYYQFDVQNPRDFRLLLDAGLAVTLTEKIALTVKIDSRYDHLPPAGFNLEKYDLELTSGLSYSF